jgi:glucose-1-phosphate adenylyltransferase
MKNVVVMLLAGGRGTRLNILAERRAKPAVPFAGTYRIIDFALSNVMYSGLQRVGVLTQYRPVSLMDHIGNGSAWDLLGKTRLIRVLPPFTGNRQSDWYRGTADAVRQNLHFIRRFSPSEVLILSGDHIYHMDYAAMILEHRRRGADLTVAAMKVPWEEASRFGLCVADPEGRIKEFEEKPDEPRSNLASMGIYVFRTEVLLNALEKGPIDRVDFGQHVIPSLLGHKQLVVYPFEGYWRDVGTIKSYWDACMDALDPASGLDLAAWKTRTNMDFPYMAELPPARILKGASVHNSLISRGCLIEGLVINSVLSPGTQVKKGAVVRDSVLLDRTVIGAGAEVDRVVLDKNVQVGDGAVVGHGQTEQANKRFPDHLRDGITLVGKDAEIPKGAKVGRNCLIFPGISRLGFLRTTLDHGETVEGKG